MAYSFDMSLLKANMQESLRASSLISGQREKSSVSFKDSINKAVRAIKQDEPKTDDGSISKIETMNKSKAKLRVKSKENDNADEDSKENQTYKIEASIEEILENLEELINIQQGLDDPSDKQTELLESIKEILCEIAEVHGGSLKPEASSISEKLSELGILLEGLYAESDVSGSLADKEFTDLLENFKKLEAGYSEKAKAASNIARDKNITESIKLQLPNEETEFEAESISKADLSDKKHMVQGLNPEDNVPIEASEKQNQVITEAKDGQGSSEEVNADIKKALDSKVVKVSTSEKEDKPRDFEMSDNKEGLKETFKTNDSVQNVKINEENILSQEQAVALDKAEAIQDTAVPVKEPTVSKSEIIGQIIKKAEILFNDVQSEMRLQLEPENLGRLTLRIAVEKGLITAKFSAESNEVKKIIESSFNELRDMLQEKGLVIENLSVSVGQNNRDFANNDNLYQMKEQVRLKSRSISTDIYNGYPEDGLTVDRRINPYNIHNGAFDQRA